MDGIINSEVIITGNLTATIDIAASINAPVVIQLNTLTYHGQSAALDKSLIISSNIRANAYLEGELYPRQAFIQKRLPITAEMIGGVQAIAADVLIEADMSGYAIEPMKVEIVSEIYGQTGDFLRSGRFGEPFVGLVIDIPIHATAVFGHIYTGGIAAPISISSQMTGLLVPQGTITKSVVISSEIEVETTTINSLYGEIDIAASLFGLSSTTEGTIDKTITIEANITAFTNYVSGDIDQMIPLTFVATGNVPNIGIVDQVVTIKSKDSNRARSYMPNGEAVPISFRHGSINTPVVIGCEAVEGGVPIIYGIGEATVFIYSDPNGTRGNVVGRGGVIDSTVIIGSEIFDTLYGVVVDKIETNAVVYDLKEGINVPKIGGHAVLGMENNSVFISKTVGYAVIAPSAIPETETYNAIFFF